MSDRTAYSVPLIHLFVLSQIDETGSVWWFAVNLCIAVGHGRSSAVPQVRC